MNQPTNIDKFQRLQMGILKIHNKTFPIFEGVNTVGRNKEAIVNIKHLNISQNHAVIVIINGDHFISDYNSSNGTFLENRKVDPFKLYELKNNSHIKLGELYGTYVTQGLLSNNDQSHFEMTQDVTQSFYGSNTQLLDNSKTNNTDHEIEDIHEAPTQEISWTTFKIPRNVKPVEKDIDQVAIEQNNIKMGSENTECQEEDIHNCNTQVIYDPFISKKAQSNKTDEFHDKIDVDAGNEHTLSNDDEDIHNAPTQILPLLPNDSDRMSNPVMGEPEIFGPFNDENLPSLENNDDYIGIQQIPEIDNALDIHESDIQVIDISKNMRSSNTNSNLEDDEATDCEDNIDVGLVDIIANPEFSDKKHGLATTLSFNQDEATDCEDCTEHSQVKLSSVQQNNNFLGSNDGSNDSMEFFKIEKQNNKEFKETINNGEVCGVSDSEVQVELNNESDNLSLAQSNSNVQTESSSDKSIRFKKKKVCLLNSDSDTDDENIGVGRKKKSLMIISSQNICEKNIDGQSLNLKLCFDSGNPIKDSSHDNKNVSSRDSYVINDTDSETEVETENKVNFEESIAATQNQSAADLNDTDCIPATQDVIKQFTSKLKVNSPKRISDTNGSSEESFKLGLTELMENPSQVIISQDPCCSKTNKSPPIFDKAGSKNSNIADDNELDGTDNTDIFLAATQKIEHSEIGRDEKSLDVETTFDTYLAPTQKIAKSGKLSRKEETLSDDLDETECFYEVPTQKLDVNEIAHHSDTKKQLDRTNNDIYLAPTQKVFNQLTDTDQNSFREESMDDLYLQPTQQADDTFNQPTQKVNIVNLEVESLREDANGCTKPNSDFELLKNTSLQNKKIFSFKRKASNLDGSLTNLITPNPMQAQPRALLQREARSSIELEFTGNVNASTEKSERPSNPLSHILGNSYQLEDMVGSETKVLETDIIHETPLVEKVILGNVNNQEEMTGEINCNNKESMDVKCRNEIKTDTGEMGTLLDNIKTKDTINTESHKDQINAKRSSIRSSIRERSKSKSNSNLSRLDAKVSGNEEHKNIKNKLDIRPIARRTTRFLASSDNKTYNVDSDDHKPQVTTDQTENSLNATNSEVNQSIALLESKITRTRKKIISAEIQVKVPKNRKSKTISEFGEVSEPSDIKYQNINKNVVSKSGREKIIKTNDPVNSDRITISGSSTSKSSITTKKNSRPKRRQSTESLLKDKKLLKVGKVTETNNNPETATSDHQTLETLKEKGPVITHDLEGMRSNDLSKGSPPARGKTRQRGKRIELTEVKSNDNDATTNSISMNFATPKKEKLQPSRQVGKRKQPAEVNSGNSDSSITSVDSNLVTPKKQKLEPNDALLNTKERGLRRQKPKVVFTMLESPQLESMIKQLGGSVVNTVNACTVLVTEQVKRSQKLLSAVGLGKPICSPQWITDSKKAHEFLDPWDYILIDKEAETKWNFSLKESLNRSRIQKLLDSHNFQIQVTNAADVLKGAIDSCGGKCITKIPSQPLKNTFIISTCDNQSKYRRITKQHTNIIVIEPEAVFDGVLRQELRFSKHYLT